MSERDTTEMPSRIYAAGCDGRDIAHAVSGDGWTERTTETVYIRADLAVERERELVNLLRAIRASGDFYVSALEICVYSDEGFVDGAAMKQAIDEALAAYDKRKEQADE